MDKKKRNISYKNNFIYYPALAFLYFFYFLYIYNITEIESQYSETWEKERKFLRVKVLLNLIVKKIFCNLSNVYFFFFFFRDFREITKKFRRKRPEKN